MQGESDTGVCSQLPGIAVQESADHLIDPSAATRGTRSVPSAIRAAALFCASTRCTRVSNS
jgi:hypothetical protein